MNVGYFYWVEHSYNCYTPQSSLLELYFHSCLLRWSRGPGQSHRNESDLSLRTSDSSLPSSWLIWLIEFILCLARPGLTVPYKISPLLSSHQNIQFWFPADLAGRLGGVTTQSPSCSPADLWDVRPCRLQTGPGLLLQEMMECHPWLSWLPHGCTALHSSRMMTVTASQQTS